MASVFDRLSQQGTAASNARLAKEKIDRERHEQRRAAAAKASKPRTNPAKLQQLQLSQDPLPIGSPSPKRTPKQRNAFFDRLAHQETASSAAHQIPDTNQGINTDHGAKSPKAKVRSPKGKSEVFNRLYKTETEATKAHHTKMKLHIRTKEEKKEHRPYQDLSLSKGDLRKQINLYHAGKISAHALAIDIINALFYRDFMPGTHWEIGAAVAEAKDTHVDKEGVSHEVFEVEKEAIWDWKDIYSAATAKGVIKLSKEDVHVDEYSYYVAG